jgi:hypothetical protein
MVLQVATFQDITDQNGVRICLPQSEMSVELI